MKKILILILLILLPMSVMAEETVCPSTETPEIFKNDPGLLATQLNDSWTLRPAINVNVLNINLRTGNIDTGLIPGAGYGVDYKGIFAVDVFSDVQFNAEPTNAGLSIVLSIFKYLSTGIGMRFAVGDEPQFEWLLGGSLPLTK